MMNENNNWEVTLTIKIPKSDTFVKDSCKDSLARGELFYDTVGKNLYIGDGKTLVCDLDPITFSDLASKLDKTVHDVTKNTENINSLQTDVNVIRESVNASREAVDSLKNSVQTNTIAINKETTDRQKADDSITKNLMSKIDTINKNLESETKDRRDVDVIMGNNLNNLIKSGSEDPDSRSDLGNTKVYIQFDN